MEYQLQTSHGTVPVTTQQPHDLIGQRVTIQDTSSVAGIQGTAKPASSTRLIQMDTAGARKLAVLMVNYANTTAPAYTQNQVRGMFFTNPDSPNAAFTAESSGTTSLVGKVNPTGDVYGWLTINIPRPTSDATCDPRAIATAAQGAATAAHIDLSGYDHIAYLLPPSGCGWGGLGEAPGRQVWINAYDPGTTAYIATHELGHNLGAGHAAALICNSNGHNVAFSSSCLNSEYGDPSDVMGSGNDAFMSSYHRAQVGFLPSQKTQVTTAAGIYPIDSINQTGKQLLLIPRRQGNQSVTSYWAVEVRGHGNNIFDNWSPTDNFLTGVTIRLVAPLNIYQNTQLIDAHPSSVLNAATPTDAPLQPDETFNDSAYNITIRNQASGNDSAQIAINMPTPPDTTPPIAPRELSLTRSDTSVSLRWNASTDTESGIDHYLILRNGSALATTKSLSFTDTNITGLLQATYSVAAIDGSNNQSLFTTVAVTFPAVVPPPDTVAPLAPAGLQAVRHGATILVTWQAAPILQEL